MDSPEKQDLSNNEISSGSSEYEDSDDEYKEISLKPIRTCRKRIIKLEKRVTPKKHPIPKKKREEEDEHMEGNSEYEPYKTNTFVYFEEKESCSKIEEVDEEMKKNLDMDECDESENDSFPQNKDSEKLTEDLLSKLLEKRSKNIAKNKSRITHLPVNPYAEKLCGYKSVNSISGRCQNIVQTYHPNVFKCSNPLSTQDVPSFLIWQEPFKYLVHQKNVVDVNKNVKNIVQRKIDERLKKRKESLMNEIMKKTQDIMKRNMSTPKQDFQNQPESKVPVNFTTEDNQIEDEDDYEETKPRIVVDDDNDDLQILDFENW